MSLTSTQKAVQFYYAWFYSFKKELEKLGKHKSSKVCLYINKLSDVDEKVLRKIIRNSVVEMSNKYECKNS